jgi:general secretion pathway protein G
MPHHASFSAFARVAIVGGFLSLAVAAGDPAPAKSDEPTAAEAVVIRIIQCRENLRLIGQGIVIYTSENAKYPPDLGTMMVAEKMEMSRFICPASTAALPDHWQDMQPDAQAKWVNAHTDYVYLGAKFRMSESSSDQPLVYDKDDDHGNAGMNVLYCDGHVGFLKLADVHKQLGAKAGSERTTQRVKSAPGAAPAIPLGTMEQARVIVAHGDIGTFKETLEEFNIRNGRYPTAQEGLDALVHKPAGNLPDWKPCLDALHPDPWNHPYIYRCPGDNGKDYEVSSAGPDGKAGTDDDVK